MMPTHKPAAGSLTVWLGILPFAAFALIFLILPTLNVVVGAFRTPEGDFTLANLAGLLSGPILGALLGASLFITFMAMPQVTANAPATTARLIHGFTSDCAKKP